jgi:hypothetical protein
MTTSLQFTLQIMMQHLSKSLRQFDLLVLRDFGLFTIMGAGVAWVLANCLAQEIPYLQESQPEGLCIATYMNASTTLGFVVMCSYLYVQHYVAHIDIPFSQSMPFLLVPITYELLRSSLVLL